MFLRLLFPLFWIFVFSSLFLCEGIILSLILYAQKYMMSGVEAFEIFGLRVFTRVNMRFFLFDERNNEWRKVNVMFFPSFVAWNASSRFRKPASMQCQTDRFVVIVVKKNSIIKYFIACDHYSIRSPNKSLFLQFFSRLFLGNSINFVHGAFIPNANDA